MKKGFSILMAMAITLIQAASALADVVEFEFEIPQPGLWMDDGGFTHVEIDGYLNVGEPGTPSLPGRALQLLVPPDHAVESVLVTPSEAVELPGSHVVYPMQAPLPLSYRGPVKFTTPDDFVYSTDAVFPFQIEEAPPIQRLRGFIIQPVVIKPVFYRPQSGTLAYYPWIKVTLNTAASKTLKNQNVAAYRGLAQDFERVAALVENPKGLDRYPERSVYPLAGDHRYVIITNQAMSSCAGPNNLQALTSDKESRGITTMIKIIEEIRSEYTGRDDAEKVRNFIIDVYQNDGTDFVLIAGDADLSDVGGETQAPIVPVRGMFVDNGGYSDSNLPSDLYYSCLDGDFNSDGDHLWGEPNDNSDLQAEVWVGRAPVDTCTEVSNFVSKTLGYQAASGNWLREVYMVGEWLWDSEPSFGKDYLYHVENTSSADGVSTMGFSESTFFQLSGLYDKDQTGQNCDDQPSPCWDTTDVLAVLNGGNHIINHLGHSFQNYNMRLETTQMESGLSNSNHFFVYTQGCYPGAFDNCWGPEQGNDVVWQDSFAEHIVLGDIGAVATVMNTRYGWGGVSNYYNRYFWDGVFGMGITRLGELNAYSKEMLSGWISDPTFRWVYYEATLFGDPELSLHTSASAASPEISLSSNDIWFMGIEGGDQPDDEIVTISNVGGGTMNWLVTSDQSWLTVNPSSGTAPTDITLSADTTGLSADDLFFEATLTITAPGATNSPLDVTVELYVITVPSEVAPILQGTAPTVDGTISAGEYDEATVIVMGSWDDETNQAWIVHDGSKLYMAFDVPSDTDADDLDSIRILTDNNADDLWPTTAGDEGLFLVTADGQTLFSSYYNPGTGVETTDWETDPAGVTALGGTASGHRVMEVSIDLATSHLVRSSGDVFGLFLLYEDFLSGSDWEKKAMWPYGIATFDNAQYFGDVTLGTGVAGLAVSPDALSFEATEGGEPTDWVNLTISSTSVDPQDFTVGTTGSWLNVSAVSGTAPEVIRVWADPSGQTSGIKNGSIQVTVPAVGTVNVPVTLDVSEAAPVFGLNPESMIFEAERDGALPAGKTLNITNPSGGGSLVWTATKAGSWFDLSVTSGTAPSTVTVTPNTSNLSAGFRAGTILFTAPNADPAAMEVLYTITVAPSLSVSPGEITQTSSLAGGSVDVEIKILNGELGTALDWSISENSPWVSMDPTSGKASSTIPSRVTVSLDPSTLSSGLHETDLTVTAPGATGSPATVHIAWTLVDAPAIGVDPGSLSFQGTVGGSNPAAQTVAITNLGTGTMNWNVTCAEAWLSCIPSSGSAPGSVSVTPAISSLAEGVHTGTLTVTSAQAANSPVNVGVTLTLTAEETPLIDVSPASLSFQGTVGGSNPPAKTLNIANAGSGDLNWSVTCAETWLACIPSSGSAPGNVSVTTAISSLSEGVYNGSVVVTSAEASNSPVNVAVTLTVSDQGVNHAPPAPELVGPSHQAKINVASPELTIRNVSDPDGDTVTYSFEVKEKGASIPNISLDDIIQGSGDTTYTNLTTDLTDGITYQWRARAVDQHDLEGAWSEYWEFTIELGGDGGGCGCTSSGSTGWGGALLLAMVLGLAVIRRKVEAE